MKKPSLSTRAIHGNAQHAEKGPVSLPIYQTTNFRFETSDDAVRFAEGDSSVYVYTRYHNPTVRDVEEKLAVMEGSEGAVLLASGMAAISTALLAAAKTGEEIISTPSLYGGTYRFFRDELPKAGIQVNYVHPDEAGAIEKMISPRTKVVYLETPTNPTLNIVDIRKLVHHVREAASNVKQEIVIMVDNTFATILNQDPFSLGADVIVESATKYLGGHSDVMGGVVLGKSDYLSKVKTVARYYGGCADPFAAYLLYRSLKTFELRVSRQNDNAGALAKALENHPKVQRVLYPGLVSHPGHETAKKQMRGFGGMVTIEVKQGKYSSPAEAAAAVCDRLKIAVHAVSLGGVETLVSIPIYSSHYNMSAQELERQGVTPGMIRISLGIEGIEDLISDFDQALNAL